jgi:hypothetical protein
VKKAPSPENGIGTFSFWGGFEAGIQSTGGSRSSEPVFANICVQKRVNRFTLRSKLEVDAQWTRTRFTLVAQARNIGRIHTFGAIHLTLTE